MAPLGDSGDIKFNRSGGGVVDGAIEAGVAGDEPPSTAGGSP